MILYYWNSKYLIISGNQTIYKYWYLNFKCTMIKQRFLAWAWVVCMKISIFDTMSIISHLFCFANLVSLWTTSRMRNGNHFFSYVIIAYAIFASLTSFCFDNCIPLFSISFVQLLSRFVHSWFPLNTTEFGLPSQADRLVRGSLNIRTICR